MTFWKVFKDTLVHGLKNRDTFALFALAVVGYLIFHAWPYLNQSITNIPVAVVDLDRSSTSRHLIQELDAAPAVNLHFITDEVSVGKEALLNNKVAVVITIDRGYEKSMALGENAPIEVTSNGAYPVKGRAVHAALAGVVTSPNRVLDQAAVLGTGTNETLLLKEEHQAPGLVTNYRFNEIGGYANYTVPIIAPVIIQAVLLMAISLSLGGWLVQKPRIPFVESALRYPIRLGLAMVFAFWVMGFVWFLYTEGFDFWFYQFGSMENPLAVLFIGTLYVLAITLMGLAITLMMGSNAYTSQAVVMISAPASFIAGTIWPIQNITNPWVYGIAQLIPSTPTIRGLVAVSQDGASMARLTWPALQLLCLCVAYALLAWYFAQKHRAALVAPEALTPSLKPKS